MGQPPLTILVIDDSPEDRATLRGLLVKDEPARYELLDADSGETGLRLWREQRPDCVLVDYLLPDMSGLDLLAAIADHADGGAPVILLTSAADADVAVEALKLGAQDYLAKDQLTPDSLRRAIAYTLERARLRREQQQTLAALRASEERLRLALDAGKQAESLLERYQLLSERTRDIVLFMRPDGRIVEANSAAAAAYGYDRDTLATMNIADLRDPATVPLIAPQLSQANEEGLLFETVHRRRDGTTFPVEVSSIGADLRGERLLLSIIRDISERVRVAADLREREQFISAVLNTTPNLLYVHDLTTNRNAFINDQIERMSGYTAAEYQALGDALIESVVHPRDLPALQAYNERLRQAGDDEVLEFEYRFRHKDGSWRWLRSRDRVFSRGADGEVRAVLGIANDVTARKEAEERLRLFEQVVMNMNDALLITEAEPIDAPGPRIVYANPAFTRMTGYTLEEIVGKSPRILQGPASSRDELDRLRSALERWKSMRIELVNYRKDGSTFDVEFDVVPIADVTGWYTHWISVQREVTERKRAEAERVQLLAQAQQARDMAEEAVRVRDQFLSIAAHELKNPLTVLLGNTQLLERRAARTGELPEREQRMLGAIREQADRLNELITSLFDVSRIEMGQLLLTRAPLDLVPLVRRIVTELQPTLTRHNLSFSGPTEPLVLEGDALRLEQVVQNLLGNAIKYSPAGGPVTVQVERRAGQGCITVTDHGIGIPETALPYLFRRFFRADNTRRQQIPGTGVGLYVVKEIVTRHGGEVLVSSTEGQGSSFTVCLPIQGQA